MSVVFRGNIVPLVVARELKKQTKIDRIAVIGNPSEFETNVAGFVKICILFSSMEISMLRSKKWL